MQSFGSVVTVLGLVAACGGSTAQPEPAAGSQAGADAGGTTPTGSGNGSGGGSGSGSGSGGGTNPTPSDAGGTPVPPHDSGSACQASGAEVVMLGDSYPALSGEITKHLESLATTAGALGSGDAYRTYYVAGTNMVGGRNPNIPTQFANAVTANKDVKYVIMDGGGNDILIGNNGCITTQPPPASASCVKTVDDAVAAAKTLFTQMQADGVQKIVYYFYPHLPTAGKPYVNDTLDYAAPIVKSACDASPVPCYFVDTCPAFEGHPEYIGPDGIHPTTAGSDIIAGLIWDVMQKQCVAQ
jgi:lysophospholipase L1-like esterase